MITVLTGAGGMVGAAILAALREQNRPVRVLAYGPSHRFGGIDVRPLPAPDADDAAFETALEGAGHVIHCAAINGEGGTISERELFDANAVLTDRLAQAASRHASGRFLYLSSIRAVAGAQWSGVVSETTVPTPTCRYGRSKLAGEEALRKAFGNEAARMAILRLAPVYGRSMRGALRGLLDLADTPWPLPFAALNAPKPVLSLQAAVDAVLVAIDDGGSPRPDYVISDAAPLSIAEIAAAYRRGLARPRRLVPLPSPTLRLAATMLGRKDAWNRLDAAQSCDPAAFARRGWVAETASAERLAELAREIAASGRG